MLGAGSAILFAALGCYITLVDAGLEQFGRQTDGRCGMLAISLASLAIRQPFTLQYAREVVDAETARLPGFLKANYIITWAWTAAFVLMLIANVLMIYVPGLPLWSGIAIAFAARNTAVYFTKWYPEYRRAKFASPFNCFRKRDSEAHREERDDEGRIRQTRHRLPLHHRVPGAVPDHRQRGAGDIGGDRGRGRPR